MISALCIGIICASFDEIHQLFIEGRSGQVIDVCIDTIGIALGICSFMLLYKIVLKIRKDGVFDRQE